MFDFYDFDLKKNSFLKSDDELHKLYDIYIYMYIYIYIYIYIIIQCALMVITKMALLQLKHLDT